MFSESFSKLPITYLVTLLPATHCDSPVLKSVGDRSASRINQCERSHISSVPAQRHMCNCVYYSSAIVSMLSCSFLCIVLSSVPCTLLVAMHSLVSFHRKSNSHGPKMCFHHLEHLVTQCHYLSPRHCWREQILDSIKTAVNAKVSFNSFNCKTSSFKNAEYSKLY